MNIDNSNIHIEECIICYNEYDIVDGIIFNCKHMLCLSCYQNILNNTSNITCPMCRQSLEISNTNELNNILIQEQKIQESEHKETSRAFDIILEQENYNITTRIDTTNISNYCRYTISILAYIILGIILLIIKDLL